MFVFNFCLICVQIYFIVNYLNKLKETQEMIKDNIQDYFELKKILNVHEFNIKNLEDEINNFKNNSIYIIQNKEGS